MKSRVILFGALATAAVGVGTFAFTRKAAAKSQGKAAFRVDPGCSRIVVLDDAAARAAARNAVAAVGMMPSSNALEVVTEALEVLFPNCSWRADPPAPIVFQNGTQQATWENIVTFVGRDTSVADLIKKAAAGGLEMAPMPLMPGLDVIAAAIDAGHGDNITAVTGTVGMQGFAVRRRADGTWEWHGGAAAGSGAELHLRDALELVLEQLITQASAQDVVKVNLGKLRLIVGPGPTPGGQWVWTLFAVRKQGPTLLASGTEANRGVATISGLDAMAV